MKIIVKKIRVLTIFLSISFGCISVPIPLKKWKQDFMFLRIRLLKKKNHMSFEAEIVLCLAY